LRGLAFPRYLGGGVARSCKGHGASCKWLASGPLGSIVLSCNGGGLVVGSIGYVVAMLADYEGSGLKAEVVEG
jgi:hypothetical protein